MLTSNWLLGSSQKQKRRFPALDKWQADIVKACDRQLFTRLKSEERPEDYGRLAFLCLFELTLFDEVKIAIKAGGVEDAVRELTKVSRQLFSSILDRFPLC